MAIRSPVQLLVPFIMGRHHHLVFNLVFTQNYSYVFLRYPISLQHWLNAVSSIAFIHIVNILET